LLRFSVIVVLLLRALPSRTRPTLEGDAFFARRL